MTEDSCPPVVVSRRIAAPAHEIFRVLADPSRHADIDGSEMVRSAVTAGPITAVGDVFVIRMLSSKRGDYEINNHVVEFEADRRLAWEPQAGRGHPDADKPRLGHRWTYQLDPDGDATVVTEIYDCSRVPEQERRGMDNGKMWRESMAVTLEHLDAVCTTTDRVG